MLGTQARFAAFGSDVVDMNGNFQDCGDTGSISKDLSTAFEHAPCGWVLIG